MHETADVVSETSQTEVFTISNATDTVNAILNGGCEDITSMIANAFNLNLSNQDSYISSMISGEEYLGEQLNNKTAGYLIKNVDLLDSYWGSASETVSLYYERMAKYSEMMSKATTNSERETAANYKKALIDPLDKAIKTIETDVKNRLNDDIDWELTPSTKKKQEATFNSWTGMFSAVDDYIKNYKSAEVDTSMYSPDFGSSGTDTSKLQDELKQRNDIIGKADSEIQPKDLTPTIDLDQLKSEVNQANGIMTGSLLAAQNAAIGDYINTDSELNPFLKDRWQNVYNFTQNNYSPKALSRIDIYRQTQNQLRLSRGM